MQFYSGPLMHLLSGVDSLENVEEIAAVEGIDMIAYGHSDLSAQLGVHLNLEHPTFKAAVRRIAAACNAHGKLARGSAETEAQIEEYWQLGCKVLNLPGNDVSTYLDGMKARAGSVRWGSVAHVKFRAAFSAGRVEQFEARS
jgi:2-keto-3-deoxy-L-rhamnonate aldolase RhmA